MKTNFYFPRTISFSKQTVPPYFIDEQNHVQYQTIIEGSTLKLSCSASGRPKPSISWYYRTASGRTVLRK